MEKSPSCTETLLENKSITCLKFENENDCFPCHSTLLSSTVGIWFSLNSIFGSFGNFVSLLTISYGLRKKNVSSSRYLKHFSKILTLYISNLFIINIPDSVYIFGDQL